MLATIINILYMILDIIFTLL